MHLLYLDDSGSIANKNEAYFVLGGVCVPETSVQWLSNQLEGLARKLNPDNPRQVEFHASEIFSGRRPPWDNYRSKQDRSQIIKDVLLVLQNAYSEIVVFGCAIHKASFPHDDLMSKAFEDLSSRFDMYLRRISIAHHEKGLIVLDKTTYENNLQELAKSFRSEGNRWGSRLKHILEVPFFVDSKASRLIQLADHIAYAVFRRYNAGDLNYFNCIEGRFDESDGVIHGLVHLQTYNPRCTCPACVTRRQSKIEIG